MTARLALRLTAISLALIAATATARQSSLRWHDHARQPQAQTPAQPAPPHKPVEATGDYLQRMDSDGDGRVSPAEYIDWMSYSFDARDRNHDGVLSADELPGGKGAPVSRQAHRQRIAERFDKQDANHDGYLDRKELSAPPQ